MSHCTRKYEIPRNFTVLCGERQSAKGHEHPCMFMLGTTRMQGPDNSLSGPFLRIEFTVSKREG